MAGIFFTILRQILLIAVIGVATTTTAYPQGFDVKQVLASVIQQLQTGTLNQPFYGFQLWQMIAQQTGNTGVYPALAALGPVSNITLNQQQQMPDGMLFSLTASHQNGTSAWNLGISRITNRIEYSNFFVNQTPPDLPDPGPVTPGSGGATPGSEACTKFPNLC